MVQGDPNMIGLIAENQEEWPERSFSLKEIHFEDEFNGLRHQIRL